MHVFDQLYSFFKRNKKKSIVLLILLAVVIIPTCVSKPESGYVELRGEPYVGSIVCKDCHSSIYDDYLQTAHHNTSSDSLPISVQNEFAEGKNRFRFNDSESVVMENQGDQYFQSLYINGQRKSSASFDITVGSGRKAQTYLYYNDKGKISQLPVSWFVSQHSWANSPGFPADHPKFDRNIPSYCMGCHSSYIGVKQTYTGLAMDEQFEKGKIIYGIDCERCHGPGLSHVQFHSSHPNEKQAKYITKISALSRIQKNDGCALCHSGFRNAQQSIFLYKPGDDINNYYVPEYPRADTANMDVHGNQAQLMMASKCYQLSEDLTCNSCHNVHVKERDDLATLSQRCITCHKDVAHANFNSHSEFNTVFEKNCIGCHMPLKASGLITMMTKSKTDAYPDYIRTHFIGIYKEESKRFMDSLHRSSKANL
jgi:hypothetical protein